MTAQFDWNCYKGNIHWLRARTIFLSVTGSHAYGTAGPDSDRDFKGVCVAPSEWVLGFLDRNFSQVDSGFDGVDCSVYELRRFFDLACENNPNVVELLWLDPSCWVKPDSTRLARAWETVAEHRDKFLSRACRHRFSGYAISQLKRIHTHRRWLLHPPTHQPVRAEFGLPEFTAIPGDQLEAAKSQIQKQVDAWELDWDAIPDEADRIAFKNRWTDSLAEMQLHADRVWSAAGRKLGFDENFLEHLANERRYRTAAAEWKQYQSWLATRNPARAELERKYGYDTKHAAHLVRLMRMAIEIAEGRGVVVMRPDAAELRDIRFRGAWTFEYLITWAEQQEARLEDAMSRSPLPRMPDRSFLNRLCSEIMREWV